MPNIKISALPIAQFPLDDPNTLFEVTTIEAGEEVSRRISLSDVSGATGLDASFLTVTANAQLPNERVLTAGTGVNFIDSGPNGTLTINASGVSFPLLAPAGSAAAPSYAFTDGDSGFFQPLDDNIQISLIGVSRFFWEQDQYSAVAGTGPTMVNAAASSTVPGFVPRRSDPDTGLGSAGGDQVSLIAGGVEIARATEAVAANQFAIVPSGSSAVPELAGLTDLDTGFRWNGLNETIWIGGGNDAWNFSTAKFYSSFSNGPALLNLVSQDDVPTVVPDHSDPNTGLGHPGSSDQLSIIAGGVEGIRVTEAAAAITVDVFGTLHVVNALNVDGVATFIDDVAFKDGGDVEIFDGTNTFRTLLTTLLAPDTFRISGAGDLEFFDVSQFNTSMRLLGGISLDVDETGVVPGTPAAGSGQFWVRNDVPNVPMFTDDNGVDWVLNAAAVSPDPLLLSSGGVAVPSYSFSVDTDTGMWNPGADVLGFSVGGILGLSLTELNGGVIPAPEATQGITAFATGGQVSATQLDSGYNVITTVATTGDSVKLPPVFAIDSVIYVKNDTANAADVFPATGDDLGAGVDTAISLDADATVSFIATLADSTWTQLTLSAGSLAIPDPLILNHTAVADNEFAFQINTDGAGFGDVKSIDINHETGAIGAGDDEAVILINIDEILATGGDIVGVEVLSTEGSADKVTGLLVGAGIGAIEQLSGVFQDADTILNIAVDVTVALSSGGAGNISAFVADNDTMTVGLSTTFQEIEVVLDTPSSGAGIDPLFEFSTGIGTWGAFTPVDGTNGMRNNGVIAWELGDIPSWATGTGGEFLIRITRQRNVLGTTPILDLMRVVVATEYFWNKDGDVDVNSITVNAGTAGSPSVAFGDGDTGFFENGDDILRVSFAGVGEWAWTASLFQGLAVDAPNIQNIASSGTVPNIRPNRSDGNTGLGSPAADQLSLIAGGVELLRAIEAGTSATDQVFLPRDGAEATPALALGATNHGFYTAGVAQINVAVSGARKLFVNSSAFTGDGVSIGVALAAGPRMLNETPSATNPTVLPRQSDVDSGLGSRTLDTVNLVAGSVRAVEYEEASNHVIQYNETHPGLTASVTQTQVGGLALLSSYNEIATVATTGDALTAFLVSAGARLVVVNNGANDLQLFPGVGDDIGAGVDASITIAAGAVGVFLGRTGVTWDTLYNASPGGGVQVSGSPLNNQLAVWTDPNTIEGDPQVTWDGTTFRIFESTVAEAIEITPNLITPVINFSGATSVSFTGPSSALGYLFDAGAQFSGNVTLDSTIPSLLFEVSGTQRGSISVLDTSMTVDVSQQTSGNLFQINDGLVTMLSVDATNGLRVFETGAEVDYIETRHDGVDGNITVFNGLDLNFIGASVGYKFDESIYVTEKTTANADFAGLGQFWVRDDVPNVPMFTDDAGTDFVLNASGGISFESFQFFADQFENPVTADWTVNALAPAAADSNNSGLTVRLFDDTTEEGVGFIIEVPTGATNIVFDFVSRAETAPGAVNTVGLDIYNRGIPDNAAVQAWSAATALTDISIPTNEFFQEDSQSVTLATLGVTAGETTQFELVRTLPGAGTDLTGDWDLLLLKVSFT